MNQGYAQSGSPAWAETQPSTIPDYKLYTVGAITLATVFGGPIAGTALMAANYRRLNKKDDAITTLVVGILGTALALLIGFLIPHDLTYPIGIGLLFGTRGAAQSLQGKLLDKHMAEGGLMESGWKAFGFSLIVLVAYFGVAFLGYFGLEYVKEGGKKITYAGGGEVLFTGSATKQDAESLGKSLQEIGYLGKRPVSVILSKENGVTAVSFVVKDGFWDEPGVAGNFEEIGREVAPSVGGYPITVRLANKLRETQKELTVGLASFGSAEIYYLGTSTESDAKALGGALQTAGYFSGPRATVLLANDNDGKALTFVVRDGFWEDPSHVAGFEQLVRDVAPSIGGLPVKLRLDSAQLEVKKETLVQ
jgi:hypothetical protein